MAKKKKKVLHVCEPFHSEAKDTWIVRYTLIDGSRKEVSRKNKKKAWDEYKKLVEVTNRIGFGATIDQKLITLLLHVIELCEEQSLKPREVVQEIVSRLSNTKSQITIAEAWKTFEKEDFENKYGDKTKGTNRAALNAFSDALGDKVVGTLTPEDAFSYSDSLKGEGKATTTIKTYMYAIIAFLDWCSKSPQSYIKTNPFKTWNSDKLPKPEEKQPKILKRDVAHRFMRLLIEKDPMLIPAILLRLFAGMRTCEMSKIDPRSVDIRNRRITITGKVAKKGKNGKEMPRIVNELDSPIWILLEPFQDSDGRLAFIDKRNHYKRQKDLMIEAGALDQDEDLDNELRHTFATYAYHRNSNAGQVRKWLGHETVGTMWKHYVDAIVIDSDARAFFEFEVDPQYHDYIRSAIAAWKIAKSKTQKAPNWPSDTALAKLVWEKPKTAIASDLSVTEAAVRKRCTKLGIDVPGRGYWQ